jgi:LAS superfamily LD-carboxypeptidase LdcB
MKKMLGFLALASLVTVSMTACEPTPTAMASSLAPALDTLPLTAADSSSQAAPTDSAVAALDSIKKPLFMEKITKEYVTGRFDPAKDARFVVVPAQYTTKENIYIRKDVLEAYKLLHAAALKDGIRFNILSAIRTFNVQKSIWEAKFLGKRTVNNKYVDQSKSDVDKALQVLEYNSMPSTSRHHWGTDIDLNSIEPAYFETEKGKKEYAWLIENAPKYGFCQTYTHKGPERLHGYEEEKWHWSYTPVSAHLTEFYAKNVSDKDIANLGFVGASVAPQLEIVKKYVLGINPVCKTAQK